MLGGLTNLPEIIKQARQMQGRMAEMQKQLASQRFSGDAGGGMVVATVDGKGTLVDIKIQPDSVGDVELLEDMIKGAVAVASQKAQEAAREELSRLTGGINVPGLSELFGGPPG